MFHVTLQFQNILLSTIDGVREITTTEYSQGYVSTLKIYSVTLGNQVCFNSFFSFISCLKSQVLISCLFLNVDYDCDESH